VGREFAVEVQPTPFVCILSVAATVIRSPVLPIIAGPRWAIALGVAVVISGCQRGSPQVEGGLPVERGIRDPSYAVSTALRRAGPAHPEDTLRVSREFGDSLSFARVVKLYHTHGKLLGLDQLLNYHLSSVDLTDGALQHFGRHGEGPREFRDPFSASFPKGLDEVWIYDFGLNRFSILDLSGPQPVFRKIAPAPSGARLLDPVVDDGLISNVLSANGTLLIGPAGEATGHRLIDLGLPFDSIAHTSVIARRLLNRTFMGGSPDGRRFAIAYQFTNQIEIVSRSGVHVATAIGPRTGNPSYRLQGERFFWNDDNVSLYAGVAASDQLIYALFCGCRFAEEQEMRLVHVFDWAGNFVREIAFDRPVLALAASADDRSLYGFVEKPYPMIVEWQLSQLAPPAS
jgi:hypothetical protein